MRLRGRGGQGEATAVSVRWDGGEGRWELRAAPLDLTWFSGDLESRLGATAVQSDCVMPRVPGGQWGHVRATLPGVSAVSEKRGDGFIGTGESGNGWAGGC